MTHLVRRTFLDIVRAGVVDLDKRDVDKVVRDDRWIAKCLKKARGDVMEAVDYLVRFCSFRIANKVHDVFQGERVEDYKIMIRFHGKDKRGMPLLMLNVTEMDRYKDHGSSDKFIPELLLRTFEDIDSGKENYKKISVLFYHGENKSMENVPDYVTLVRQIQDGYFNIVDTFYIFEDVISSECKRALGILEFFTSLKVKFVSQYTSKNILNFDVETYEKENLALKEKQKKETGPAKQSNPTKEQISIKWTPPVSKTTKKNVNDKETQEVMEKNKGYDDGNEDGASGVKSEVGEMDKPSKSEEGRNAELKNVLKKLHNIQMDINNIIRDVMEIL